MLDNVKLFGEDGMLQSQFNVKQVLFYNEAGYLMERITTKEQIQELIDFLEDCKEEME